MNIYSNDRKFWESYTTGTSSNIEALQQFRFGASTMLPHKTFIQLALT